jgi:hypothetical protein
VSTIRSTVLAIVTVLVVPAVLLAAEFDRTVQASAGMRLDVRLFGGEVAVRAWEKDEVRVRSSHFSSDEIEMVTSGKEIQVRARTRVGAPHGIDLEIDVPAWMAANVVGPYVDVTFSGTRAGVSVETVRGDIRVTGGQGTIALSSIEGQVVLDGATGQAKLRAANNGIRVAGFHGTLQAETVDGSVRLLQVAATDVDVSTMSGDILWEGPLVADGRYQLVTHSGDIDVTLPAASSDVTITAHALEGHVLSRFAPRLVPSSDHQVALVLGSGSQRFDVESFNGMISLRPAEAGR